MWFFYQFTAIFFWAAMNVVDSVLIRHYQKNPFVLGWNLSAISLFTLCILGLFLDVKTEWTAWLLVGGATGYIGDLTFYRAIRELDVSIVNIAWSLMAIFIGIASFYFFGERWSSLQFLGVALVIGGIVFLSLWHQKIESPRSLIWLPLVALCFVPFYIIQKAILLEGASVFPVFFWMIVGRELTTLIVPLVIPSLRSRLITFASSAPWSFYGWAAFAITLFTCANFLTTSAFASGPASLVSVVGNAQPFIVLFFAWLFVQLAPTVAPKELLSAQSVTVKIISFLIVFLGLALLAIPQ